MREYIHSMTAGQLIAVSFTIGVLAGIALTFLVFAIANWHINRQFKKNRPW